MYQTVGQDAIELIANALEVPLYRRIISGSAVEQGSEYGTRTHIAAVEGDETEDLFALLSTVKVSQHPDIQGVSVGAILSNYQRVRVEHVCHRLGLIPLCYLWQRDQESLLSEMIDVGMEAVVIKVAGIGLTVNHLGKSLAEMQPTLKKLHDLYGSHICGEGGEYETLTLDCPMFKHRIIPDDVEKVIHSDNDFATVAFLRIKRASTISKKQESYILSVPDLLDDDYTGLLSTISRSSTGITQGKMYDKHVPTINVAASSLAKGPWISITNIQRSGDSLSTIAVEDEVSECFAIAKGEHTCYTLSIIIFTILLGLLSQHELCLSDCTFINIYLSSIDYFSRVNAIYSTFFGTSPPARACVAVDLPTPINVRLDCLAFTERSSRDRKALHVQGLSYWAPANIGPYSQAIMACKYSHYNHACCTYLKSGR
ncbi:hypothetical protein AX17_001386 [Amanita inopinata Kibby_2008]|nr:hypothetical protein AX17_001386 [Amanita inopinata Kibby_2008]